MDLVQERGMYIRQREQYMQRLVGKRQHAPDFLRVTYSKKSITNLHFQENFVSENCKCKYFVCILIQVLESLGEGSTVISLNIVNLIYRFLLFCVFFFRLTNGASRQ